MDRLLFPTRWRRPLLPLLTLCVALLIAATATAQEEEADPPEIVNGERLFLETRFAQLFRDIIGPDGDVNTTLGQGDPNLDDTVNWQLPDGPLAAGPFAGQSVNCRACHFVDEHLEDQGYGMRTYTDFARRSPIPDRSDRAELGRTTPRNAPPLVNASLPRADFLLHFDGEFPTLEDLIEGTFTGPNFGWRPGEKREAIRHICRVIREDDGSGALAQEFGALSYRQMFTGELDDGTPVPDELLLPEALRVDVPNAKCREIVPAAVKLVAIYTENLVFSQDEEGGFNLSPYDVFLQANGLPRVPGPGRTNLEYSRRLLAKISALEEKDALNVVTGNPHTPDGTFLFHDQPYEFGERELEGLMIFFAEPESDSRHPSFPKSRHSRHDRFGHHRDRHFKGGGTGNCIACHQAPVFTNFSFRNTGTAQTEYDRLHGDGAFARLVHARVPSLKERSRHPDRYLPATEEHPRAREPFRRSPTLENATYTDLGAWNIFANPDFPRPQRALWRSLCTDQLRAEFPHLRDADEIVHFLDKILGYQLASKVVRNCSLSRLLPKTVALFKTAGLRDLGHSAPYMQNGQFDTLEQVIGFYQGVSALARAGHLVNGSPSIAGIDLVEDDVEPLAAFLRALNEDYE